jgi:hypothetical protein
MIYNMQENNGSFQFVYANKILVLFNYLQCYIYRVIINVSNIVYS